MKIKKDLELGSRPQFSQNLSYKRFFIGNIAYYGSPIGLSGRVDTKESLGKCSKKGWELSPNAAGAKLERRETNCVKTFKEIMIALDW